MKIQESDNDRIREKYKNKIKKHFDELATIREKWIRKADGFYKEDHLMMREFIPDNSSVL